MAESIQSGAARAAFLAERSRGIGGSDAPVILGLSKFSTPLQLWLSKTGRAEETPDNPVLRRGRKLEAVVASEYEEETGRTVRPGTFAVHPEIPWMLGHADRLIVSAHREDPGVLEAKAANVFKIREWDEEAPLPAQVQLQHYLAVTGLQWGSVAGLLGGIEFKYQDLERNEEFIGRLIEQERNFWSLVEMDIPPEPVAKDTKILNRLFEAIEGVSVELPEEALAWDRVRLQTGTEIKRLEELRDEADAKLKAAIGTAEVGLLPGGAGKYSFREQTRRSYVVQEATFRVLRRAK